MATLRREGGELVVKLNDLEKLGALHGDVRVPWPAVTGVRVSESPFRELRGMRAPGTGLPGVIALGTWRGTGGKEFAALYRGGPAVIVTLESGEWRRLLVSDQNASALAEELREDLPEWQARPPA
ncbi:MAG TPA: hypothetical protein VLK36_02785 [Gaiellaceae bacterium]|nr:hypothetical protein [Gaiellaceae bacterium]